MLNATAAQITFKPLVKYILANGDELDRCWTTHDRDNALENMRFAGRHEGVGVRVIAFDRNDGVAVHVKVGRTLVVQFYAQYWEGCCALCYVSRFRVYPPGLRSHNGFMEKMKECFLSFLRNHAGVHRCYFAFSDEELIYQPQLAKFLGFKEEVKPFVSVNTDNMIHITHMDLPNEEAQHLAISNWEDRERDRKIDNYSSIYDED